MKVTLCFSEQVLRKRPYLSIALCLEVLANPLMTARQPDGRVRYWAMVTDPRDDVVRALRVVTLKDGVTLHNAFYDRDFKEMDGETALLS